MTIGASRTHRRIRRLAIAVLLAGTAGPVAANSADGSAAAQAPDQGQHQEIVVTGHVLFPDVQAERSLDQSAIESYGASTIDELLANLQAELGDLDDGPLIIVNGVKINNLDEIAALPIEVLREVQVLPRGTAVRAGGRPGQRVISLSLKRRVRTLTALAAPKVSTEGHWSAARGEAIVTQVRGDTRANIALRTRAESSLLESDRGLIQPNPLRPFALAGNVIGFPNTSGEIDPLLSALAGRTVIVSPFPAPSSPALADFVAGANDPAFTDIGEFRTLRPRTRNYDLNGTFATRLAPWLTGSATFRLNRNGTRSLRGLPSAVFVLDDANPASPFSRDVGLALYGRDPLQSRSRRQGGEANVTLNGTFGEWTGNFNAKHADSRTVTTSERSLGGTIVLANSANPFATDLGDLIALRSDRSSSRNISDLLQLTFNGPAATLPAGPITATIEGRLAWNRLRSSSTFDLLNPNRSFRRAEQGIRGAVEVPFTSGASGFGGRVGDISGTAEYERIHFSDAGTLDHYELGLTWEPIEALRLRGSIEKTEIPAIIQFLGDPVFIDTDVRTFDPLTGSTVDVTQITGGNSALRPEEVTLRRLNALVRLVPRLNLQLNAEYTDRDSRNFVSSLPESSAAVMLAFPDRFVRDSNGVLTTIDLRPVNFDSHREKRLRWGFSMNAKLAGGTPVTAPRRTPGERPKPSTYLQLTANHSMVFSDKMVIRPGLDPVDLLGGGSIGIGGGRLRHQLDGTAAVNSGGSGLRLGVTWRGRSSLESRFGGISDTLRFSPVLLLNLRAFADVGRFARDSKWAKGLRLSLDVVNVTNDRQRVRDSLGNTPLQYQPAYRDPLGRTVEFEIRKVF